MYVFSYSPICTVTTFLAPTPPRLYLVRHNGLEKTQNDVILKTMKCGMIKENNCFTSIPSARTACVINLHVYPAWAVCDWPVCVRVCLVLDFSVANPSAWLGGPNGDIFSADITSPERPLMRSQSFHNSPGKWPLGPRPLAVVARQRGLALFTVSARWEIVSVIWQRIHPSEVSLAH